MTQFKIGQQVMLPGYGEEHYGTVSRLDDKTFTVTFHNPKRRSGEPRERHTYPNALADHFTMVTSHG